MRTSTTEETVNDIEAMLANIEKAKRLSVKVGVFNDVKYPDTRRSNGHLRKGGQSVLDVGLMHEFGTDKIPRRSFLRMPFEVKSKEIESAIQKTFNSVAEKGLDAEIALGRIGAVASSIVEEAFQTGGFGNWKSLKESTVKEKGNSDILDDVGILKRSINWKVST